MGIGTRIAGAIRRLSGRPTRAQLEHSLAARYLPPPDEAPPRATDRTLSIVTRGANADSAISGAGWKLTPDRLFWIYNMAEQGYPALQCDAFESIKENDGHLTGLVETRRDDVLGQPCAILPGDDRPGSVMAAKTLAELLDQTNFETLLEHGLTAVGYGYAFAETQWALDGTWVVPRWFVCAPHRRFRFDREDVAHLTTDADAAGGIPISDDPWRWVVAQRYHRRAARAGLFRTTSWWALFKRMSVRDWIAFAEKFGIPMVIGKYSEDAPPAARFALEEAVRRIGFDGNAIMHEDTRIEVMDKLARAGDSTSLHPSIISTANAEMSKAFTGATLNAETGGPGSFALGKVHAGRAHVLSVADARFAGRWFRCFSRYFVEINGIANAAPPRLHVGLLPENPLQDAQMLNTLGEMGLPLSVSQIHHRFALKAPSSADDTLKRPLDAKPTGAAPPR
jgi:phage gp29-like protein